MSRAEANRASIAGFSQRVAVALIMVALAVAGGAVLFYVADRGPSDAPRAVAGFMDLSSWDFERSGPLSLTGDWGFVPGSFGATSDSGDSRRVVAKVPGDWRAAAGRAMPGAYGFGSYHLSILRRPGLSGLELLVPDEAIAWRLYVDGALVATNGNPAETASGTSVRRESLLARLPDGESRTELRIEVANYSYDVGGLINPILIGRTRDLATRLEALALLDGFILGCLVVLALYHLVLFIARIDDRSSLYFSAFCFLLLVRSVAIDHFPERLFSGSGLFGLTPFDISTRVEYIAFYLCIPAYLAFARSLFPAESSRAALRSSAVLGLAFVVPVLALPVPVFMAWTTRPYQAITLVSCAYALWVFGRAAARRRPGAVYGLAGFTVVMLAALNDILHANLVIHTAHLAPLGLLVFMIAQSIIVSSRIADTFRHERQLARELAEEKGLLDRRIAERTAELRASNERLRDVDKSKSRFLATISHELRTPISLIVSPVEQAMRGRYGEAVPAESELFAALKRNGYRLLNIVEGMFDFARLELGKLEPRLEAAEPGRLMALYVAELESLAQKKGISLSYEDGLRLPCSIRIDPKLFEIAFFNLATNALKFTRAGGSVRIATRLEGEDEGPEGLRLAVSVEDTGIGIEAELLPRIFDKLAWGATPGAPAAAGDAGAAKAVADRERLYDGAGIGLSLSKKIVELHAGTIRAASEAGKGSTFTILLPAFIETVEETSVAGIGSRVRSILGEVQDLGGIPKETSASTRPGIAAGGEGSKALSLLLVEDNRELREFVAGRLEAGFEVRSAGDGREALASLETAGLPDIVITDVMMPVMDGSRLYKEARRIYGEACPPFVFLTARSDPDERREALAEGAVDYLEKPFDPDELELRALSLVAMRERARSGAKRDLREALSRFLETAEAPAALAAGGQSAADKPSPLAMLTAREAEIARCAAEGLQDKEIAARLGISARTVSNTMIRIYRKAGLENRLALIRLIN